MNSHNLGEDIYSCNQFIRTQRQPNERFWMFVMSHFGEESQIDWGEIMASLDPRHHVQSPENGSLLSHGLNLNLDSIE
jgi:hypothetical protein